MRGAERTTSRRRTTGECPSPRDRLLAEMRRIKSASNLSYGRLAARTNYSSSSWERFLNGKQLPTEVAVEQLATVAGEDPAVLRELWERATTESAPTPCPEGRIPANRPRLPVPWRRRLTALGYVALGAAAGSVVTLVLADGEAGRHTTAAPAPAVGAVKVGCTGELCLSHEPQAMDCHWDGQTVRQTWLRGLQIQLRYSAACHAVWGRIENGTVGDSVEIKDKRGRNEEARIRVGTDTYTRMLSVTSEAPPDTVTICGVIPSEHQEECSPVAAPAP
ncbi:helix-turn-helix domain-containing protein [Streptomyces sp. NPDC002536]